MLSLPAAVSRMSCYTLGRDCQGIRAVPLGADALCSFFWWYTFLCSSTVTDQVCARCARGCKEQDSLWKARYYDNPSTLGLLMNVYAHSTDCSLAEVVIFSSEIT